MNRMNTLTTLFISVLTLSFYQSTLGVVAKPFDYMVLAQSWPPAFCATIKALFFWTYFQYVSVQFSTIQLSRFQSKRTGPKCSAPIISNNFTIHDLWDNYVPSIIPPGPCSTTQFDPNEVAGIKSELDTNWPNLKNQKDNNRIWAHEFERHGTCMADVLDMEAYFHTGLRWKYAFNFLDLLKSGGINPGGSYPKSLVASAIQKAVKFDVVLVCSKDKKNLVEIRLCVNRQGTEVISCSGKGLTGNCGPAITFVS